MSTPHLRVHCILSVLFHVPNAILAQIPLGPVGEHTFPNTAQCSLCPIFNLPPMTPLLSVNQCPVSEHSIPNSGQVSLGIVGVHTSHTSAHSPMNLKKPESISEFSG